MRQRVDGVLRLLLVDDRTRSPVRELPSVMRKVPRFRLGDSDWGEMRQTFIRLERYRVLEEGVSVQGGGFKRVVVGGSRDLLEVPHIALPASSCDDGVVDVLLFVVSGADCFWVFVLRDSVGHLSPSWPPHEVLVVVDAVVERISVRGFVHRHSLGLDGRCEVLPVAKCP